MAVPQSEAPRVSRSIVLLLAAMSAVGPLAIDMYLPSLPALAHDLSSSLAAAQESVAVFFAGLAVGQLFYGTASDRFGRRGPLLFGFALFTLGSIIAVFATGMGALIAGRVVQSLGACAGMVITRAIVRDHFDHRGSAGFFSLLALVAGAAPILAPSIGSLILTVGGWRSIFVVLAVFGAVVFVCVLLVLPESRSQAVAERARLEHPLRAYAGLIAQRRLLGYLLAGAFNSACMFTYIASASAVLMGVYGVTPTVFGLLFGINSVGLIGASQLNRMLLRRYSPDQILGAAALMAVACTGLVVLVALTPAGVWAMIAALFLTISCSSLIQANALAGALSVDASRPGAAAALFGACGFGLGAGTASAAGALSNGTALPMGLVLAACATGCAAALYLLAFRRVRGKASPETVAPTSVA